MKAEVRKLAALSAIIEQDLNAVARLDAELSGLRSALDAPTPAFRDLAAMAYLLHNLYCAMENAFEQISRTFENHVTDPAQWHKELLGKMFLEIPTVRPAVLPPDLRSFLNNLRGFRHLFRHSYDFEIDPARLAALVRDWTHAQPGLTAALSRFRDRLLEQVTQAETDAEPDGA
jgi:hypothetical protein